MRIPNGSTILVIPAVSPNLAGGGGGVSSDAFNLQGYYGAMLIGATGSNAGGTTGLKYKVVRSGTSNGTYNPFGFTTSGLVSGSGATIVRNFLINTSCVWHKVVTNSAGAGSFSAYVYLLGFKGPYEPVLTQNSNPGVTVQADVLVG